MKNLIEWLAALFLIPLAGNCCGQTVNFPSGDSKTVRVFIFAGQSNMEGADSRVGDISRFPPFAGLDQPQIDVLFSYILGREDKRASGGWVALQPVNNVVGPELSFAREIVRATGDPVAIIKCAAGGTTLANDWNPATPGGFELYPLALNLVKSSLADLDARGIPYRIEGFMWHQGENDMFNEEYKQEYGANLKGFLESWRRDLETPDLDFYIGELCTKTIWGMDNRDNMYAIRKGQRSVTEADARASYVPTSHISVEIGGGAGLHYHYGTLGQLEHGVNYAEAYLERLGQKPVSNRTLEVWPYEEGSTVKLFVLAGHRNMEGERAFTKELENLNGYESLARSNQEIAYRYSTGGGFRISRGWEPLGPAGSYETFGPELGFSTRLQRAGEGNFAIAKFTHSGSQINDWTPEGTSAVERNLYREFIRFIKDSVRELNANGNEVQLEGIFYHVGENDMAFGPNRRNAALWLGEIVRQSRSDLQNPGLMWFVSQQIPVDQEGLNSIDITKDLAQLAAADPALVHLRAFDLPPQQEQLVITAEGIVRLGEILAEGYLIQK